MYIPCIVIPASPFIKVEGLVVQLIKHYAMKT
jgi:hypothetical protein